MTPTQAPAHGSPAAPTPIQTVPITDCAIEPSETDRARAVQTALITSRFSHPPDFPSSTGTRVGPRNVSGGCDTAGVTETQDQSTEAVVVEVYEEAGPPIAGGQWEVLADDRVRYVRRDGRIEPPAIIPASTLRTSPTGCQVR